MTGMTLKFARAWRVSKVVAVRAALTIDQAIEQVFQLEFQLSYAK